MREDARRWGKNREIKRIKKQGSIKIEKLKENTENSERTETSKEMKINERHQDKDRHIHTKLEREERRDLEANERKMLFHRTTYSCIGCGLKNSRVNIDHFTLAPPELCNSAGLPKTPEPHDTHSRLINK